MLKRPIFLAGLVCLAGTAGAFFAPVIWLTPLLILLGLSAGLLLRPEERKTLLLSTFCGLLCCLSVFCWQDRAERLRSFAGETVRLEGMVTDVEIGTGWVRHEVRVDLLGKAETMSLFSYEEDPLPPGQRFTALVELAETDPRYHSMNLGLQGSTLELVDNGEDNGLFAVALRIRSALIQRMEKLFHGTGREILMGLLLGEKASISYETQEIFEKSGTAHLLTVSGFHISMMAGGIYAFLRMLGSSPKPAAAAMFPLIFLLVLVEGMTVSVVRAAVMAAIFYLALILERDYDGLSAWGFVLIGTLLYSPELLFSRSFLLSYSAVLGILLFQQKIYNYIVELLPLPSSHSRWLRPFIRIVQLFSVTLSANSIVLPFLLLFFGYIPVISLISSILAFPLLPPIMVTAVAAIFCPIAPVANIFAWAAEFLAEILYRILAELADWNLILYGESGLLLAGILLFFLLLILIHRSPAAVRRRWMAGYALSFFLLYGLSEVFLPAQAELTACRSALVLTYNNRAVIVGAPEQESDRREIEKVLNCAAVEAVDVFLITRKPEDDGLTALNMQKQHQPQVMAAIVPLDAFDLTNNSYQLGSHNIDFWNEWTLHTEENGAILSNGRCSAALFSSLSENCEADAIFWEKYVCRISENMEWNLSWDGQPRLIFEVE